MISATTAKPIRPPWLLGNITQATVVTTTASSTSRLGRSTVFPCGCRWRTTSSSSARTSSGNATRSAYVQPVPRRDTMRDAVSRPDYQLTLTVHLGRLALQRIAAGQQHAHRAADRRAIPPVRREQPGHLGVGIRLAPARIPGGDAA